jgi:molybdopterin molybdotransferase
MPEFFNVLPPAEALALLFAHLTHRTPPERLATRTAQGRVTARQIWAPHDLPSFRRSTMDGYAVRAADTHGASESLPAFLTVVGEVPMGNRAGITLSAGQAALVHTGGMLPQTADAVVQVELTQQLQESSPFPYEIEIFRSVAAGQNVLQVGEDVQSGAEVLAAGHLLRPQDLGGLLALGIIDVPVSQRPHIGILATGDEVVAPERAPGPGQIRDINSYTVGGQTEKAGGIPVYGGIIGDNLAELRSSAETLLATTDMLVLSAGSSVSVRDMTVEVIDGLGEPGILLHGVATRPGKPTIVGAVAGKPVIGLPGNPVSAMIQFDMFGVPAIYRLQGMETRPQRGLVLARLSQNIASETGREDYVPARLEAGGDGLQAIPVFGKSNLIYTLVNADGLIRIPLNKGGVIAGDLVEVLLF